MYGNRDSATATILLATTIATLSGCGSSNDPDVEGGAGADTGGTVGEPSGSSAVVDGTATGTTLALGATTGSTAMTEVSGTTERGLTSETGSATNETGSTVGTGGTTEESTSTANAVDGTEEADADTTYATAHDGGPLAGGTADSSETGSAATSTDASSGTAAADDETDDHASTTGGQVSTGGNLDDAGESSDAGDSAGEPGIAGALDLTFGEGGIVVADLGGDDRLYDVLVQVDGGIVVAGESQGRALLARFDASGILDPTFADSGFSTFAPGTGSTASYQAIAQQQDGSILAAGSVENSTSDFLVSRFSRDGELDPTFGSNGHVMVDFFASTDRGFALQVLHDDDFVICGSALTNQEYFACARFVPDGTLDDRFDSDGRATFGFRSDDARCHALALDASGELIALGYRYTASGDRLIVLMRLTGTGTLDLDFGVAGVTVLAPLNASAEDVVTVEGSRIVVAGTYPMQDRMLPAFYGLTATGEGDTAFAEQGLAVFDFGDDTAFHAALIEQGSLLGVGSSPFEILAARTTARGDLDPTFGTDGMVQIALPIPASPFLLHASTVQPDGRVVSVGTTESGNQDLLILRLE